MLTGLFFACDQNKQRQLEFFHPGKKTFGA